jgi:hypothetical protein
MLLSTSYLMTTPANARLLICAPALVIGMSSYFLKLIQLSSAIRRLRIFLPLMTIFFRVLEMAEEFPHVEFRGLDLGAWYSSLMDDS